MKQYDTTFIIKGTLEPDQREELIAKYSATLEKFGGSIDRIVRWGLRDLSYEINKCKRGYYVFFYYNAESATIHKFESEMKLNENILRYMTTLFDGNHPDYIKDETKKDDETVSVMEEIPTPVIEDVIITDTPVDDSTEEVVETIDTDEPEVTENEADTEYTDTPAETDNSEETEVNDDEKIDVAEE